MYINALEFLEKNPMQQMDLANLTGLSRYTISKAMNNPYDNYFFVDDQKYFEMHKENPSLFPLPKDFKYYSKLSITINRYMNKLSQKTFRSECIHASYLYNHQGYIYNIKDKMDKVFPHFYLPFYNVDGKWVFYDSPYMLPEVKEQLPTEPIKIVSRKNSTVSNEEFDTYSLRNVILNVLCRDMQKKDLSMQLGMSERDIYRFIKYGGDEKSLYVHKEYLHELFSPYIIPVEIKRRKDILDIKTANLEPFVGKK